jgi:hypothetical protein
MPIEVRAARHVLDVRNAYRDSGWIDPADVIQFSFRCENLGQSPVTFGRIRRGCSCTSVTLQSTGVQPGAEYDIAVRVEFKNRTGPFSTSLSIEVIGERTEWISFFISGAFRNLSLCSSKSLFLGEASPGQKVVRYAVIRQSQDNPFRVGDVLVDRGAETQPIAPRVKASVRFLQGASFQIETISVPETVQSYPGSDDVVLIFLADSPPGPYSGQIEVVLNSLKGTETIRLPFRGTVLPGLRATPPGILLSKSHPKATLTISSLDKANSLTPKSITLSSPMDGVSAQATSSSDAGVKIEVEVQAFKSQKVTDFNDVAIMFPDGRILRVPVVIQH